MTYKQTKLWRAAFEETRTDATSEECGRLAGCYGEMRARASALVAKIAADLPHMTIHDVTHLDALWEMASIACGNQVDMNPAEAFVFGGAVLLHDAAMSLAAFPGGVIELKKTTEWRDLYARHSGALSEGTVVTVAAIEHRATEDALRLLHAKQAENLPKISWVGPRGEPMFIIEDQQIRNFYGPKIGKVAHSHWWPIAKVEDELAGTLGALAGVTNCTVDLLKVACILRVADAMHLDQRRAPAFEYALSQPVGISADHWKFQERMAKPFPQGDALVYTAQPPFEVEVAEAWWTAFDALQMVDRELRNVDRILRVRQKRTLLVRRVEGVHAPEDLAATVETVGWTPVDSTIRVSDVPKIVATLGGSKLYGKSVTAAIRELIQNGLDAITARRRLQSRPNKWGELQVVLDKREDGHWFSVEDNGVGMSTTVLTGPLIDFGNSFWKSSLAVQEFPGLASAGMKARGKYGIGFFSVFMLGDHVRVITRRHDRDSRSGKVLEFRNGLGSRPNLRDAGLSEAPLDGGTRVEVRLRRNPADPDGILYQEVFGVAHIHKLNEVVGAIAPATDVAIKVVQDGTAVATINAGDWLEIDSGTLLNRISRSRGAKKPPVELAELRDEEGRIYGRACIDPSAPSWALTGLVTVDGLAGSLIGPVSGIFVGVETTASRNAAQPIVPSSVLAAWASEQAIAIAGADLAEDEKAKAAGTVMACGGDVGNLPVVWWEGEWRSASQLAATVRGLETLDLHIGQISHDDDDDVTRRQFQASFEADPNIAQTVDASRGSEWIAVIAAGSGSTPKQVIERILLSEWGAMESGEASITVGEVNGVGINRAVLAYSRVRNENVALD